MRHIPLARLLAALSIVATAQAVAAEGTAERQRALPLKASSASDADLLAEAGQDKLAFVTLRCPPKAGLEG